MQLIEVSNPETIHLFHKVPFKLHSNDPHWVPYLKQDVNKIFDPAKNKLFKEGGSAIRWILKDDTGKLIGRVAAFVNPKTMKTTSFMTGGIGFFDSINDKHAAFLLFDTCREWLKAKGMEAMDGPINFGDRNQFWGCQVSNFEEPPIYQMNYNPPYYRDLFEEYGFHTYFEQYMFWRDVHVPAQEIFHRKYNQLKNDQDFRIENIKGKPLKQIAEDFRTVYNAAWGGHSHFKEMSYDAAQKIFKVMKPVIDPEIVIFVYHKNIPVAFYLNLPELNQIFRFVKGDLNLIGKLKFLYHKWNRTANRMTGIAFGVVKEWQGKGLEAAMIVFGEKHIGARNIYADTVLSWIGDFNPKMIKVAQNLDTKLWRTFITYRYQFDRTLPFERAPIVAEQRTNPTEKATNSANS